MAGVDSLTARLGHLLRVASKMDAIRPRRHRSSSDGDPGSAPSDASSAGLQRDEVMSPSDNPQASPHKESMPAKSLGEGTGSRKHRTPIGKAIGKLQLSSERSSSSSKAHLTVTWQVEINSGC